MKINESVTSTCPLCNQRYSGRPAVSRKDNKLLICPDCGTREALASIGISNKEQNEIINIIHRNSFF